MTIMTELYMYVGCYTNKSPDGIFVYSFNQETGAVKEIQRLSNLDHASFLTIDSQNRRLYSVSEKVSDDPQVSGDVHSFAIENKGRLRPINKQQTLGQAPCHLSLNKAMNRLAVVNYKRGNLVLYPIEAAGEIGLPLDSVQHIGSSVNLDRQESAHPHAACFHGREDILFIPDLGQDKIITYLIDNDRLSMLVETNVAEGAGPRHLAIHPDLPFAYLINELDATVTSFYYNDGKLTYLQNISCTLPKNNKMNMAAEIKIHPNGHILYCSSRGHDNITIFQINLDGTLTFFDLITTMLKTPRHFNITPNGKFLIVANQDDNNLVRFKIDLETGGLTEPEIIAEASEPVCINFLLMV